MRVSVGGPTSEIEAESKRKLITEKEVKQSLSGNYSRQELESVKIRLRELLSFYDRILRSIQATIKTVNGKTQLTQKAKDNMYLKNQEKELAQAKREKSRYRRYLQKLNDKLTELK